MRNTTKSLLFCLFVLSFCWASDNLQPLPKSQNAVGNNGPSMANPSVSASISNVAGVDFLKLGMDVLKKLGDKPSVLLTIEGESFPKLFQKAIQIADKVVPDCSSLMSLAITGFAGGASCPGVDEKAGCYAVLFFYAGNVEPVFLFKAKSDCVLVKNLVENKASTETLKTITRSTDKNCCWHAYGKDSLLKALDKELQKFFPFIYQEKNPDSGVKMILDINFWSDVFQKIENKEVAFLKFLWDTFVGLDFKRVEIGFDIADKTLESKIFVYPQEYSALASFSKSLESKIKNVRFLNWSSQEVVQELVFQDYSGLKNYVNSWNDRIKFSQNTECVLLKDVWTMFYPLLEKILTFCDENFTGNTQSYADLQNSENLVSSKGFGFFEGKQLKREKVLAFIEDFSGQLKSSLKEAVDKKFPNWAFCKDITLDVKKSAEKHCGCDIDQIFWKGNNNEAYCPIWFAVYKNYLLYADDIGNLKRLLERMEAMKELSYLSLESNCYSRMKVGFVSALRALGMPQPQSVSGLSGVITCGLNAGVLVNTVKVFGFLDLFSLKTILPPTDVNVRTEDVNIKTEGDKQINHPTAVPMGK